MGFDDILYRRACSRARFVQDESSKWYQLEIWTYKTQNGTRVLQGYKPRALPLACSDVENWLQQRGDYRPPVPAGCTISGGLCLLIHQWPEGDNHGIIPFSRKISDSIIKHLRLPRSFSYDLIKDYTIVPRKQQVRHSNGENTAYIFQSPRYGTDFLSAALSFDPASKVTSGFLGYISSDQGIWNGLDTLVSDLTDLGHLASHPLLLPTLILETLCNNYNQDLKRIQNDLRDVQRNLGTMQQYFLRQDGEVYGQQLIEWDKNHAKLVINHNELTGETFTFMSDFCTSCFDILDEKPSQLESTEQIKQSTLEKQSDHQELRDFLSRSKRILAIQFHHRQRLQDRISVHFNVLYNLMQQRDNQTNSAIATTSIDIAKATKEDGSAMKSISLLTMVFLPGTAVATIFSMSPFFYAAPSTFNVSPQFFIYWIVTIPLTLTVLLVWYLWQNTRVLQWEFRAFGFGRGKKDAGGSSQV